MAKRPSFQFYPKDYREDLGLRACSLAARGLWVELMCLAHDGEPYGHLARGGNVLSPADIARNAGASPREVSRCIEELERWGVFSRAESGAIYSRRMVRDEQLREVRAAYGKAGAEGGYLAGSNPNASVRGDARKGGRPTARRGDVRGVSEPPIKPPPSSPSPSATPTTEERMLAAGSLLGDAREAPPASSKAACVPLSSHRPAVPDPPPNGRPQNPLISGEQHRANQAEALELVGKIAALTGEDPAEVFASASEYTDRNGNKRRAMNPAAMSPERLALTLSDLRGTLAEAKRHSDAGSRQSVAEITEHRRRLRQSGGPS